MLMTINPTMSIPGSQQENEEIYFNQMRTREFPNHPNGAKPTYLVSFKKPIIFKSSVHQKLAKEFLSYFVQPENLGPYIKGACGHYFPIMSQLWTDSFWSDTKDPHISIAFQQLRGNQTRSFENSINPAYFQVNSENIWGKAMQEVLVDGLLPTEVTDRAINQIHKIFSQWKN